MLTLVPAMNGEFIYELIESLTKSERRMVAVSLRKNQIGKSSRASEIFASIAQKGREVDSALSKDFPDLKKSTLLVLKRKCYLAILDVLVPGSNTPSGKIYQIKEIIDFLIRKSLYHQTHQFITKGKLVCQQQMDYHEEISLIEIEASVLWGSRDYNAA